MHHFKYCLFFILLVSTANILPHYSQKELATLIKIEYRALQAQENLLQQSKNNDNVRRSIEQTISRIKNQIRLLEEQKDTLKTE
ncbi:MAG: hypothetical protein M1114_04405 [Candidatus Dependentiae bacterium]|nr:hypothetical protein [Candidatus Dependentiae bacterium]